MPTFSFIHLNEAIFLCSCTAGFQLLYILEDFFFSTLIEGSSITLCTLLMSEKFEYTFCVLIDLLEIFCLLVVSSHML